MAKPDDLAPASTANPGASGGDAVAGGAAGGTAAPPSGPEVLAPGASGRPAELPRAVPVERRATKRYPVWWRGLLTVHGRASENTHHGRIPEISLAGCSIIISKNYEAPLSASMQILLPARDNGALPEVVAVEGFLQHAVFSGRHYSFLAHIQFAKFKEGGCAALEARLRS